MFDVGPARICLAIVVTAASAAGSLQARTSIRAVDFRNFEYSQVVRGETIKVVDGRFERETEDDTLVYTILDVDYGDLDGDGREEAVVTTLLNTGGTGQFTDALVFSLRRGEPVVVTVVGGGDRADGGIHDVRVRKDRLVVERYGQERSGACCPEFVERTVYELRGVELVAATTERVAYQVGSDMRGGPQRVHFMRGGSGAILAGVTNARESFVVGARTGQTVRIRFDSKDSSAMATLAAPGGRVLSTLRAGGEAESVLPVTGDFVLSVSSSASDARNAYYVLEMTIR